MKYDSDISVVDTLLVMSAAIFTAVLAEGLSYALIYRTEDYKNIKKNLESLTKQLAKEKDKIVTASKQKIQEKKIGSFKAFLQMARNSFENSEPTNLIPFKKNGDCRSFRKFVHIPTLQQC